MYIRTYVHYNKAVIIVQSTTIEHYMCHQYCVLRLGNNRGNHDSFSNDNRIVSDFNFVLIIIS